MTRKPTEELRRNELQLRQQWRDDIATIKSSLAVYEATGQSDATLHYCLLMACLFSARTLRSGTRVITCLVPHLEAPGDTVGEEPWPAVDDIARWLEITPRTVKKALKRLDEAGIIDLEAQTFNFEKAAEFEAGQLNRLITGSIAEYGDLGTLP